MPTAAIGMPKATSFRTSSGWIPAPLGHEELEQEIHSREQQGSAGDGGAGKEQPGPQRVPGAVSSQQIQAGQRDADDLGGEPHLAANRDVEVDGAEREENRQHDVLAAGALAVALLSKVLQQQVEERQAQGRADHREEHVVELQPQNRDEGHEQHGREGREAHVPLVVDPRPILVVGRRHPETQLPVQKGIRLVDEMGIERLVRHPLAGEGAEDQQAHREQQQRRSRALQKWRGQRGGQCFRRRWLLAHEVSRLLRRASRVA